MKATDEYGPLILLFNTSSGGAGLMLTGSEVV